MSKTCEDRVEKELRERIEDIRKLWKTYCNNTGYADEDLGTFEEYGLCADYVAPGTFSDQKRGYFRWQLSWGGPSDEFRFYMDENLKAIEIEYWFLDWFDGACINLTGSDYQLLEEIFTSYFKESGVKEYEREKSY